MIEGQEGVTWDEWVALAETSEANGVEALFRSDHYLSMSDEGRPVLDAWATIAALAARTTKLELGTLVSPATFRHPSVLARNAATADEVSGGRITVGMGAGWMEREHDAYGFDDVYEEYDKYVLGRIDTPYTRYLREKGLLERFAEHNGSLTARGLKKPSRIWDIGHQHLGRSSRLRRRSCGISIPESLECARESMWRSSTFPRLRDRGGSPFGEWSS